MSKIQNVSMFGDIVIPVLDLTVKAGEIIDMPDEEQAAHLVDQGTFVMADKAAKTPAAPAAPAEPVAEATN